MPGFVAAVNVAPEVRSRLLARFRVHWPSASVFDGDSFSFAEHSWSGGGSQGLSSSCHVLVDGSAEIFEELHASTRLAEPELLNSSFDEWPLESSGVLLRIGTKAGTADAIVDESGAFPLYYALSGTGLLVGTSPSVLAYALGAAPDMTGVMQFLQGGAIVGRRSIFANVSRLLPGQHLRYSDRNVSVRDTSRAWSGIHELDSASLVSAALELMRSNLSVAMPDSIIMASGGWDSRTLIGVRAAAGLPVHAYVHGDLESREAAIVRKVVRVVGGQLRERAIDEEVLDWKSLNESFGRTNNAVFPHWHLAGSFAQREGFRSVAAGVLGEVIGGHYGPAMIGTPARRAIELAKGLSGIQSSGTVPGGSDARRLLERQSIPRGGWYFSVDALATVSRATDETLVEVNERVDGLLRRGVTSDAQLLEAFITETRGAQYICAQLGSCRANVDVEVPFARRSFFRFASMVPIEVKIHNRLNRMVLQKVNPALLSLPLAATLVPASFPIAAQEISRLVRRTVEGSPFQRLIFSGGEMGWVNFDFMRKSSRLFDCIDSLSSDLWDRRKMTENARAVQAGTSWISPHPLYDQINKIHTIDMELRAAR